MLQLLPWPGRSPIVIGSLVLNIWYFWHISYVVTVSFICFHIPGQKYIFSSSVPSLHLITPRQLECILLNMSLLSDHGITLLRPCCFLYSVYLCMSRMVLICWCYFVRPCTFLHVVIVRDSLLCGFSDFL